MYVFQRGNASHHHKYLVTSESHYRPWKAIIYTGVWYHQAAYNVYNYIHIKPHKVVIFKHM